MAIIKQIETVYYDDQTGEVFGAESAVEKVDTSKKITITKAIIDDILKRTYESGKRLTEMSVEEKSIIYAFLKGARRINPRGQYRLLGERKPNAVLLMLTKSGVGNEIIQTVTLAHPFTCILMANKKTAISSWTDLYEEIGCTSKRKQQTLKKFLESNKFIRTINMPNRQGVMGKKLILNPFLFRDASYCERFAISLFQDFIKESINLDTYTIKYLMSMGYIAEYENISKEREE